VLRQFASQVEGLIKIALNLQDLCSVDH
jgi:hypothetical protein